MHRRLRRPTRCRPAGGGIGFELKAVSDEAISFAASLGPLVGFVAHRSYGRLGQLRRVDHGRLGTTAWNGLGSAARSGLGASALASIVGSDWLPSSACEGVNKLTKDLPALACRVPAEQAGHISDRRAGLRLRGQGRRAARASSRRRQCLAIAARTAPTGPPFWNAVTTLRIALSPASAVRTAPTGPPSWNAVRQVGADKRGRGPLLPAHHPGTPAADIGVPTVAKRAAPTGPPSWNAACASGPTVAKRAAPTGPPSWNAESDNRASVADSREESRSYRPTILERRG